MKFKNKGYKYKGYELGQKVMYGGKECIIIGFDESVVYLDFIALYIGLPSGMLKLSKSTYVNTALIGYENCTYWKWVKPSEIQKIEELLKEDVLSIKVKQINNEYSAVEITYQNEDVLKRGNFEDMKVKSLSFPLWYTPKDMLFIRGYKEELDNRPFIVENKYVEVIEERVRLINEKYGIPKRWRAELGEKFYYINECMEVDEVIEYFYKFSNDLYDSGNYFKTKEEAEDKAEEMKKLLGGK